MHAFRATAAALLALSLGSSAFAQDAEAPAPAVEEPAPAAAEEPAPALESDEPVAAPEDQAQSGAHAEEGATHHYPLEHPHLLDWSFAGPFGHYDPAQLQRGFNVYVTVCQSCHGLTRVAFRNLADEGGLHYTEEEARAYAAAQTIPDATTPEGQRPGALSDYFQDPGVVINGVHPPDLSLMAKARSVTRGFPTFVFDIFTQYQEGGPNYIYSLLTGYQNPPAGVEASEGQFYNPYFIAGPSLSMAPPLVDGAVPYPVNHEDEDPANDIPETVDQYAKDVSAFLMWAAEPHMMARKSMGLTVVVFLIIMAGLVYYTKKKVWAPLHREEAHT